MAEKRTAGNPLLGLTNQSRMIARSLASDNRPKLTRRLLLKREIPKPAITSLEIPNPPRASTGKEYEPESSHEIRKRSGILARKLRSPSTVPL